MMTVPKGKLEFHGRNVNQIVHDGINCQARRRMNLKFSGNVSTMGNHRVDGDIKVIGNLLVGHSLNQSHYHIFFSIAQLFIVHRSLINHA